MKITDIISSGTNGINVAQGSAEASEITAKVAAQLFKEIKNLVSGQTIQGEIVSRNGEDVTLRLDNSLLINAKVASDITLELGKNVTFEVRNNGKTLTLSPLMTNMASANPTAVKALKLAEIPVEPRTLAMTENMMKAGLPIDKDSLLEVYRDVANYETAPVEDIVDLHVLGVQVNEEDIVQIASYKELSHYLSDGLGELANNIGTGLQNMIQTISEGNALPENIVLTQSLVSALSEVVAESTIIPDLDPIAIPNANVAASSIVESESNAVGTTDNELLQETEVMTSVEAVADVAEIESVGIKTNPETPDRTPEPVQDPKAVAAGQVLKDVEKALETGDLKALREIASKNDFIERIVEGLKSSWAIDAESVKDGNRLNQFFKRVLEDMASIRTSTGNGNVLGQSALGAMNNVNSNIDFLNQMNHMFTYIQLPLKNSEGNYNGELYVFSNKRNVSSGDGTVTAHIHLDMDNLGPVDVHVTLKQDNVKTDFTVADDNMLTFIEEHMDLLSERLNKRGYSCEAKVAVVPKEEDSEAFSGIKPVLEALNTGSRLLSRFAFDVRA